MSVLKHGGVVRPVYGAQYPPLTSHEESRDGAFRSEEAVSNAAQLGSKFKKYEDSVSDAWETSVTVDALVASTSAAKVLERHAAMAARDLIMPPVNPTPSKNSKVQAMQRLATQKEPIPGSAVALLNVGATSAAASGLYPRLPEVSAEHRVVSVLDSSKSTTTVKGTSSRNASPVDVGTRSAGRDRDQSRFDRLRAQLGFLSESSDDYSHPPQNGYLPTNFERREVTLARKRQEYWHYVEQYFYTRFEEQHQDTYRQIHIDIPRMCPLIPLFQQKIVQEIFERVLYIWAIRHPASGYVQGINDLVTPFFVVFLSEFIADDAEVGAYSVDQLPREQLDIVEADSFWCVSTLLDTIQDNYTFAQPGIQRKILQLRHLMSRVDRQLHQHLEAHGVEYLQFAFRWMNNLLMREIPLRATIRLWDTYLSERNGFSQFHGYVCAAFLRMWSKQLQAEKDFQGIMILLQNLPTHSWGDQQICELTADAYSLMSVFEGAKNHLIDDSCAP
ncbi:unnamed protein product [Toxocara canis]|uniref:TBC1 domain family member 22B n=1 Tax=Toxocara canis TaxID=6265 RepID=A0A183UNW6_TOXCA|nr:unnamed protein product [Toxocara canis]